MHALPLTENRFFGAIRTSDEGEWLDVRTISFTREGVDEIARRNDARITHWAKANPVVRVVRFRIEEVVE